MPDAHEGCLEPFGPSSEGFGGAESTTSSGRPMAPWVEEGKDATAGHRVQADDHGDTTQNRGCRAHLAQSVADNQRGAAGEENPPGSWGLRATSSKNAPRYKMKGLRKGIRCVGSPSGLCARCTEGLGPLWWGRTSPRKPPQGSSPPWTPQGQDAALALWSRRSQCP